MHFLSHSLNNVVSCLGDERTELEPRPIRTPKKGEILLKLRVVGLCGTDLFKLTTNNINEGMVLGHEFVGEVVTLGSGVTNFSIGDRVAVPHHVPCKDCLFCLNGSETMCDKFRENLIDPGGFADHVIIKPRATSHAAYRLPDGINDNVAVFLEPAACVLRGINRSNLQADGSAAIIGGGSMGLLHLLVIRATRPKVHILVIDPRLDRCAFARELGADVTSEPGPSAFNMAMEMTNGFGVDAVFDTVGGGKVLDAGIALSRKGGTIVLFAHAPDNEQTSLNLNSVFKHEKRIVGSYSGSLTEQSTIFDLMISKCIDPTLLVSHTMPLDDFASAYKLAREGKALKILFTPSRAAIKL